MHISAGSPLDSYPAVRSSEPEYIRTEVARIYGARHVEFSRRRPKPNVRANHWQSKNIALSYCSYGDAVHVLFPEASFYRIQMCLSGRAEMEVGRRQVELTPDRSGVISPDTQLINRFAPGYDQLVLRIDARALHAKLAALLGAMPRVELQFETISEKPEFHSLKRLVMFLSQELDAQGGGAPVLPLLDLEQAIMMSFLLVNTNNYSAHLSAEPRAVAPWQVRAVEQYIEAHWQEPLSVEELAQVSSASVRSIFFHFRKSRGISPMQFLKQVRLRHARRILSDDNKDTVTEVAYRCGFGNLGHFARDYARLFGERPSETARSSRKSY